MAGRLRLQGDESPSASSPATSRFETGHPPWLPHRWGAPPGLVHRLDRDTSGVLVREPGLRAAIEALGRQFLHAARLGFEHPGTRERLELEAPLPADLRAVLETLAGEPAARARRPLTP